jgi:hypothetical protein
VRSIRPALRSLPLGQLAIVAYFGCAVALGTLPSVTSLTHAGIASALAFSPADLLAGELWRLPLSGLVVDGGTWTQLADLVPVALLLVLLADSRTFWRAAIGGHVGSTLVAYAVVGALALADPAALGQLVTELDYGVSCIWAGCLGALATVAARRGSRRGVSAALFAACTLPALRLVSPGLVSGSGTLQLATLEHALAFAIGALAAQRSPRHVPWVRRRRRADSGESPPAGSTLTSRASCGRIQYSSTSTLTVTRTGTATSSPIGPNRRSTAITPIATRAGWSFTARAITSGSIR